MTHVIVTLEFLQDMRQHMAPPNDLDLKSPEMLHKLLHLDDRVKIERITPTVEGCVRLDLSGDDLPDGAVRLSYTYDEPIPDQPRPLSLKIEPV